MEITHHRSRGSRYAGDVGSVLMMSVFLGILSVAILTYEERSVGNVADGIVVSVIGILTCFLGLFFTVYLIVSVCYNKTKWIQCKDSHLPTATKVNMGFLWIFGVVKCTFCFIYVGFYIRCEFAVQSKIVNSIWIHGLVNIMFEILQMIFLTHTIRYTFLYSVKMKYVMSFIALGNLVEWIRSTLHRFAGNNDVLFSPDENGTYQVNCSYVQSNTARRFAQITTYIRLPVTLEFAVLATSLVFGLTERKTMPRLIKSLRDLNSSGTTGQSNSHPIFFYPKMKIGLLLVVGAVWNIPSLVLLPWTAIERSPILVKVSTSFLCSLKIFILILILAINQNFFRKLNIVLHNKEVNFNEIALIVSSMAVTAISMSGLLIEENDPGLILYQVSNIIGVFYQTILIIAGHRFEDLGNDLDISQNTKLLVLLLSSINMTNWVVNSIAGLRQSKHQYYRLIQITLHPFLAYYRFQSFTELLSLYEQIKY